MDLITGKATSLIRQATVVEPRSSIARHPLDYLLRSTHNQEEMCQHQDTLQKLSLLLCSEHVGDHSTRISRLGEGFGTLV